MHYDTMYKYGKSWFHVSLEKKAYHEEAVKLVMLKRYIFEEG